jgi:hypothetical protein
MALDAALMRVIARLDALERQAERKAAADLAIAAGQITTSMLAANAVTQAAMSTGNGGTSTSTSYFTLSGNGASSELRADLTTTGGALLVFLFGQSYHSVAANSNFFAVSLDGAAEVGERYTTAPAPLYSFQTVIGYLFTGVSAAAHIVRGRAKTTGATMSLESRTLIVIELKK